MIVSQMSVKNMLKIFEQLNKEGFDYCDMESFNNLQQDTIKILVKDCYKTIKQPAKIKLTTSIINSIIA